MIKSFSQSYYIVQYEEMLGGGFFLSMQVSFIVALEVFESNLCVDTWSR